MTEPKRKTPFDTLRQKAKSGSLHPADLESAIQKSKSLPEELRLYFMTQIDGFSCDIQGTLGNNYHIRKSHVREVLLKEYFRIHEEEPALSDRHQADPFIIDRWIIGQSSLSSSIDIPDKVNYDTYLLFLSDSNARIYLFQAKMAFKGEATIGVRIPDDIVSDWTNNKRKIEAGVSRSLLEYSGTAVAPGKWKVVDEIDPSWNYRIAKPNYLDGRTELPLLVNPTR